LNNIKIGNLNHIIEFTPEITKSKSSYNNFYINQNSNINLNSNNINNINNNNLELSYKVIEFLSLLTNITKNNSKKNPNMQKMIQNFEKTKKNLFELSKKYIEHNNLNENKIYSGKSSSNSTNENAKNNKISKNEMQLILMNNNIENIKKGIKYKELIEKINYLSSNINKLEKQNKQLSKINDSTKKELINNTLLLSKKNSQLNLLSKEKAQFISTINVLKKDNESLMELIQEKKVNPEKEIKKKEIPNANTKEINLIKQKDKIINDLRKKIKELDKKFLDRNNETKNLNNKIKE
jgi:DNA repair exonuclease SbcCD ATPase subunit